MLLTVNQVAISVGVAVFGAIFVALLGADPQDTTAGLTSRDFTTAFVGCTWVLVALAAATGFLASRLPGPRTPESRTAAADVARAASGPGHP